MKPVMQTTKTNCFEACIASILEIDINIVPDLMASEDRWQADLNTWLVMHGKVYIEIRITREVTDYFDCRDFYHILIGKNPSNNVSHAVVGRAGKMVHDPNPLGQGIVEDEMWHIGILVDSAIRNPKS